MNYQYRYGTTTFQAMEILYKKVSTWMDMAAEVVEVVVVVVVVVVAVVEVVAGGGGEVLLHFTLLISQG